MNKILNILIGRTKSVRSILTVAFFGSLVIQWFQGEDILSSLIFSIIYVGVIRGIFGFNDWLYNRKGMQFPIYNGEDIDVESLKKIRDELLKIHLSERGHLRALLTEEKLVYTISLLIIAFSPYLFIANNENAFNWLSVFGLGIAFYTLEVQQGKERITKSIEQIERKIQELEENQRENKINNIESMLNQIESMIKHNQKELENKIDNIDSMLNQIESIIKHKRNEDNRTEDS